MLTAIPKRAIRGTTVACRLSCGLSPEEGWALALTLRGPGTADIDATADGDAFLVELPTTEMDPGLWFWQATATNETTGAVQVPLSGEITIEPSLTDQEAGYDGRTEARKALDAINAVLADKATKDQASYTIKGRALTRYPVADLLKLRAFFVAKVRREEGRGGFKKIGVVF